MAFVAALPPPPPANTLASWLAIVFVAAFAVLGEVLLAAGMRRAGDQERRNRQHGLKGMVRGLARNMVFLAGAVCMALNFFCMLFALSITQLSLAGPAIGALTYIGNAIAAKAFLHENVDSRRWLATLFVAIGVILLR